MTNAQRAGVVLVLLVCLAIVLPTVGLIVSGFWLGVAFELEKPTPATVNHGDAALGSILIGVATLIAALLAGAP